MAFMTPVHTQPTHIFKAWATGAIALLAVTLIHFCAAILLSWGATHPEGSPDIGAMGMTISLNTLNNAAPIKPAQATQPAQTTKEVSIKNVTKQPISPVKPHVKNSIAATPEPIIPEPIVPHVTPTPLVTINQDTKTESENENENTDESINGNEGEGETNNSALAAAGSEYAGTKETYISQIAQWLAKHKKYPASAKRRRHEGKVILHFVIDAQGDVINYNIVGTSGFDTLDAEALKMIQRATPFPDIPAELGLQHLSISVPIAFDLRRG